MYLVKKRIVFLLMIFLLAISPHTHAANFTNGFGLGFQYGGVIGWQPGIVAGKNKFRLGIGYTGMALGYDRFLTPEVSFGGQLFFNQFFIGGSVNANYHLKTARGSWIFGLDVYRAIDTVDGYVELISQMFEIIVGEDLVDSAKPETGVSVSVGYHF